MKIRSQLVWLVVGMLAPMLAFAGGMLVLFNQHTRGATERGLVETARALSVAVDQQVGASIATLEALATSEHLRRGDLRAFDKAAREVVATQRAWQNVILYGPDGRQLVNTWSPFGARLPMAANAEVIARTFRTGAPVVSDLFVGAVLRRPLILVVVPVIRDGAQPYALGAVLMPAALTDVLLQQGVPPDAIGTLLDRNKVIIARTRAAERFIGQRGTVDLAAKMDETAEGAFRLFTKEGQAVYAAISRSPRTGWTIALGVPQIAADAPLRSSLWLLLLFSAASVLGGVWVAVRGARRISGPMASLATAAKALVKGEPVKLAPASLTEINEVARAMELASHERRQRDVAADALAEVGRELVGTFDLAHIVDRIVHAVVDLFQVRRASLYQMDRATDELVCVAVAGAGDHAPWVGQRLQKGEGVSGLVLADGSLLSSPDMLADPRLTVPEWLRECLQTVGFSGVTAAPLTARGLTLGVLVLGYESGRVFGDEAMGLLSALANQAAVALENARLFSESDARRQTAESLADVGRLVSESLEPAEVGQATVDNLRRLLGAHVSTLYRLDPKSDALVAIAMSGASSAPAMPRLVFPRGAGVVGRAVEERLPVVSQDVLADSQITFPPEVSAHIHSMGVRAALAVPLMVQNRVIGALGAGDHAGRRFTAEDIRLVQAFADQVAVAMDHARLHGEIRQRLVDSQTLLAVAQEVSATLDPTEMMRRVAREAARALGAEMAGAFLADPDHTALRPIAGYHVPRHLLKEFMAFAIPLRGHRILEEAWRLRQAVALHDVSGDPRVDRDAIARFPHRSSVFCPMIVQGEPIGGLFLAWLEHERQVSPSELRLVEGIARQAGIALANARLVEELRTRQARLEALLAVDRQLSRIQPVESLLAQIAEACGRLFDATSVFFRLLEGDELVLCGEWGSTPPEFSTARLKLGGSLPGLVALTGAALVVRDPAEDPRLKPAYRDIYRRLGIRAFLGVPVKTGDQVTGVLTVRTCREEGFSPADVEMAQAFAAQAAAALENSRLYQETRRALDELSQTQAQLTQAQKMEAIGQLAGGIAHDFNNLLTVISGRSQLFLDAATDGDPRRRDVQLIAETADRAAALTHQLLAFSRKQVLQPTPLDLNAVVGELAPMLRRLIGEHIELVIVPGGTLSWVMADPGQLQQVVMNLAVNARDAMSDGGTVRIETENRDLHEAVQHGQGQIPPGQYVGLVVHDTGCGMDAGTLARIFEPFFTTKEPGKGTGLGLATVHGIVHQSGGYIGVDSAVGRGTTFTIYLPTTAAPAEARPTSSGVAVLPRGHETVLLVEDDQPVRDLAHEVLRRCGYTVLQTGDPLDALLLEEQHRGRIQLLLSDMVMPAMRGPVLAGQLHARAPEMRILYMSGYTDDMIGPTGAIDPPGALLHKPFTPAALAWAVRDALDAVSQGPPVVTTPR